MVDIIIIGAGTAGMTAALYAARADKSVMLIEGEVFGGQITYSPKIENYPSVTEISGNEFANNLFEQVTSLGVEYAFEKVVSLTLDGNEKVVKTEDGEYRARAVIIATGARNRRLGVEGEDELVGYGISYCAVCDGAFFRDKTVGVVGGGSTAVGDAIYLSAYCKKVYLIHRREGFRAEDTTLEALRKKTNVEFCLNKTISELLRSGDKLSGVVLHDKISGEDNKLDLDGLFVAVGQEPQNKIFESLIDLDDKGYVKAGEDCRTKTAGIFVAGDCRTKMLRQLTTAAADGSIAAVAACEYLDA